MDDTLLWRLAELLDVEPEYLDHAAEAFRRADKAGMSIGAWILSRTCGLGRDLAIFLQDLDTTAQNALVIADIGAANFWAWWAESRARFAAMETDDVFTG